MSASRNCFCGPVVGRIQAPEVLVDGAVPRMATICISRRKPPSPVSVPREYWEDEDTPKYFQDELGNFLELQ
jgi:hypothetical protein